MKLSRMIGVLSTLKLHGYEEERKEILLLLQRIEASAGLSHRKCYCCDIDTVEDFLLTKAIQMQVCPEIDRFLCLSCIEDSLRRDLRVSDFEPVRMNSAAIYFLKKNEILLENAYADLGVRLLPVEQCETE